MCRRSKYHDFSVPPVSQQDQVVRKQFGVQLHERTAAHGLLDGLDQGSERFHLMGPVQ